MATLRSFEEVEAWQAARSLVREVYAATKTGGFSQDRPLREQIRKASVSVMSNIAEGFERGGTTKFLHFLSIAKGSAGEVSSQLVVALDQEYLSADEFKKLDQMARRTRSIVAGLMTYLQRTNIRGARFLHQKAAVSGGITKNQRRETDNVSP